MNPIRWFLSQPIDKQGHFWAGATIALVAGMISHNAALAFFVAMLAAGLRERLGNSDLADFKATMLGASMAVIVVFFSLWFQS